MKDETVFLKDIRNCSACQQDHDGLIVHPRDFEKDPDELPEYNMVTTCPILGTTIYVKYLLKEDIEKIQAEITRRIQSRVQLN